MPTKPDNRPHFAACKWPYPNSDAGPSTQTNSRRAPIDIRIASPVVSEHGEAKDPDEAIRNNGAEWIASIDQADEIIDFVIRTSLSSHNTATENGLDAALNEIEPYFENIPPRTIREQRKLNASLAEELGIDCRRHCKIHVLNSSDQPAKRSKKHRTPDRQLAP